MRRVVLLIMTTFLLPAALLAQAAPASQAPGIAPPAAANKPAPPAGLGAGRVAVLDFQAALAGSGEGKKAQEELVAEINKRQGEVDKKVKELQDKQNKRQTAEKALSEAAKADLDREIDRLQTDIQRLNDDASRDIQDLQQKLVTPIGQRIQKIVQSYANEMGFAVVLDASSVVHYSDIADITTEIIRRADADAAKIAKPAAPAGK